MVFSQDEIEFVSFFLYELVRERVESFPFADGEKSRQLFREFSDRLRQQNPRDFGRYNGTRILFCPTPCSGEPNRFYKIVSHANSVHDVLLFKSNL